MVNRCSNRSTFPLQLYLPAFGILLLASDCKAFLRCFHSAARKYYSFAFELPGCAFYLPIMSAEASFPGQDSRFISIFALSPDTTFPGSQIPSFWVAVSITHFLFAFHFPASTYIQAYRDTFSYIPPRTDVCGRGWFSLRNFSRGLAHSSYQGLFPVIPLSALVAQFGQFWWFWLAPRSLYQEPAVHPGVVNA